MSIICEMGQKLPFIDMNAASMVICIPSAPVERNASRYIHVFNAKNGDLVHELQFESKQHLTPLAVKVSPDSDLLACFSVEDACVRIWGIKQSWTASFRLSPKANLPAKCIKCDLQGAKLEAPAAGAKPLSHLHGYQLKWVSDKELHLQRDNCTIERIQHL